VSAQESSHSHGPHAGPRIVEFLSAFQTDPIRPLFDGKNATFPAMTTSKNKMENYEQRVHKSATLCRRSQLPLVSSQVRSERTLARARAIEQSAAP
jgi:hypothetical protein